MSATKTVYGTYNDATGLMASVTTTGDVRWKFNGTYNDDAGQSFKVTVHDEWEGTLVTTKSFERFADAEAYADSI